MAQPTLPLSDLFSVTVTVSPQSPATPQFNQALIVGNSATIPNATRLVQFTGSTILAQMAAYGFSTMGSEYTAATQYVAQSPPPNYLWIGRQDTTALGTIAIDGRSVTDGAMLTSHNDLASATIAFVSGDVGAAVCVLGAGSAGADLTTTIASIGSSTLALLTASCSTSVDGDTIVIGRGVTDGSMSSSVTPTYLSSSTANFVSGDVGSTVVVEGAGAGGVSLVATIASISSSTVAVLNASCLTTVSGATVTIGRSAGDGQMATAATTLLSNTAAFVSGDAGSTVIVAGAGAAGAPLVTTIASYNNAKSVTLTTGASTTVAGAQTSLGFTGSGYAAGDEVAVTQAGASGGVVQVLTVGVSGQVLTAQVFSGAQGTAYTMANGLSTVAISPSTGTGLKVNITAIGETPLQAVTACRIASPAWYLVYAIQAADADNIALVEYAQATAPQMQVFFTTTSTAVYNPNISTDIFSVLKAGSYNRYQGVFSTTQSGLAPNNAYLAAGLMGVAMGLNTGLANSNFTLAFKQIVGMTTEPLTLIQFLAIQAKNGNAYVNFNNAFNWYQNSITGSGQYFDQILVIDMLAANLQYDEADLLNSLPSVPQTDSGQAQLIHVANQACQNSVTLGALAPGVWTGPTLIVGNTTLAPGTSLPNGYLCFSAPIATQSSAARAARQAMPIYVAVILAGSMQSLVIALYVQQ